MKIEQMFTGCLAEMAYYIESNGEAVIIDPLREVEPYLEKAKNDNATIKYVFLTHFHADFVSGHVDLAKKTGATIVYGPGAKAEFELYNGTDGEEFKIGDVTLKLLHTPGHTMESISLLLLDENNKEHCVFTGDALFIGDVGRPDLAVKSDLTQEDLAGFLFDSLRTKLMTLPDEVIVYPNHGAGSACGKKMSSETWDTLGNQKATNYALRADMTKEEFIAELLDGIMPPPQYFPKNAMLNKSINKEIDTILEKGTIALDLETFKSMAEHKEALVIDTRKPQEFCNGHVPNSLFFGIDGSFAPWIGALITDINQPIIFVANEGREEEVVTRLSRIGYDNTLGYLKGGIEAWEAAGEEVATIKSVTPEEMSEDLLAGKIDLVDIRKQSEYDAEHVEGASHAPLDWINQNKWTLDKDKTIHIQCAGGYRSVIFTSIMRTRGYHNLVDVAGGFRYIKANMDWPLTEYVCPSTEL